jgi:flagellar hook assembly protein FlgD
LNFHHGNSAESCVLYQNYPNPFNAATMIRCKIPASGKGPVNAELRIYNVRGRLIRTLIAKENSAGMYQFLWDGLDEWGTDVAAGIYLYSIYNGAFAAKNKMILMK